MGAAKLLQMRGFENRTRMQRTEFQKRSIDKVKAAFSPAEVNALLGRVGVTVRVSVRNDSRCVCELAEGGELPVYSREQDVFILRLKGPAPLGGIPCARTNAVSLVYSAALEPGQMAPFIYAMGRGLFLSPAHIQMRLDRNGEDQRLQALLLDKLKYRAVLCNGFDEVFTWRFDKRAASGANEWTHRHVVEAMRDEGDQGSPLIHVIAGKCVGVGQLPCLGERYLWVVDQGRGRCRFLWDWPLDEPLRGSLFIRCFDLTRFSTANVAEQDVLEGIVRYEAATRDPKAQVLLGDCYKEGCGYEKDAQKALRWYSLAAQAGDPLGLFREGCCYLYGAGTEKDERKAKSLIQRAASLGCSHAQERMGYLSANGSRVFDDAAAAVPWYEKAAKQGDRQAQYYLGRRLYLGHGVPRDLKAAFDLYLLAARQGESRAMGQLSACYRLGKGTAQDEHMSYLWSRAAAAYGDDDGINELGMYCLKGTVCAPDDRLAAQCFRLSAAKGNASAQNNLGYCYRNGRGVEKDGRAAVQWLRQAIANGSDIAHKTLGLCYLEGFGVEKDEQEGVRLLKRAVELGVKSAQDELDKLGT